MDAILKTQAEKLAQEIAGRATSLDDLNGFMRSMMKSALERMLNTEMDVHLGRREVSAAAKMTTTAAEPPAPHGRPRARHSRMAATSASVRGRFTYSNQSAGRPAHSRSTYRNGHSAQSVQYVRGAPHSNARPSMSS